MHAAFEHSMEKFLEARVIAFLRVRIVIDRFVREEQSQHRAHSLHDGRNLKLFAGNEQPLSEPRGFFLKCAVGRIVELRKRGQSGLHRQRISRQSACLIDGPLRCDERHDLFLAAVSADRKAASQRLKTDVGKHISDICERYFIPGETQDIALMFVPSESIYAELHEHFEDVAQRAYKARIVIVGPSLLMLAIQVVQAILRDQRMREQAHVIQTEVSRLLEDVGRLRDRVNNLQTHFGQANKDIEQIITSADKIGKRGTRIESLEFAEEAEALPRAMQKTLAAGE